jgi:hypothetical protein
MIPIKYPLDKNYLEQDYGNYFVIKLENYSPLNSHIKKMLVYQSTLKKLAIKNGS